MRDDSRQHSIEEPLKCLRNLEDPRGAYFRAANGFLDHFRKDAWKAVFDRIGAEKLMSRKVRERFTTDLDQGSSIDFTAANITSVVGNLIADAPKIIRESILDVFEHLCSFDPRNKV